MESGIRPGLEDGRRSEGRGGGMGMCASKIWHYIYSSLVFFLCVCVCDFQARMSSTREVSWGNSSPRYSKSVKMATLDCSLLRKQRDLQSDEGAVFQKFTVQPFYKLLPPFHTPRNYMAQRQSCAAGQWAIMNHIKDWNWPRSWILVKSKPSVKSPIGLWTNVLKPFGIMGVGICIFWSQKWDIWIKIGSDWELEDTLWKHVVNHNRAKSWSIPCFIVYFALKGTKLYKMNKIYI